MHPNPSRVHPGATMEKGPIMYGQVSDLSILLAAAALMLENLSSWLHRSTPAVSLGCTGRPLASSGRSGRPLAAIVAAAERWRAAQPSFAAGCKERQTLASVGSANMPAKTAQPCSSLLVLLPPPPFLRFATSLLRFLSTPVVRLLFFHARSLLCMF
jgi:hypothetical protein